MLRGLVLTTGLKGLMFKDDCCEGSLVIIPVPRVFLVAIGRSGTPSHSTSAPRPPGSVMMVMV